ncbi:MAG TPA: hypothetical protein VFN94_05335 [Nitrospiria bacterium]|nr:hypothetical protein [Nitrospiria bacterium]
MTIGEIEEFLWSLSTCLEGEIGNWRLRFGGAWVSVRADPDADEVVISAAVSGHESIARRGSPASATTTARLSVLTINALQAAFQHVVDLAHQTARSDPPEP